MRPSALLASAALAAAACAGRSAGPSGAASAAPPQGPAAPAASAARYGADPELAPTHLEASALDVARGRLGAGGQRPRVSGALVAAARELAAAAAAGDPGALGRGRVRAALARAGAWDPAPTAVLVEAPAASLRQVLAGALARGSATHVGAGAAARGGRTVLVVLSEERKATLSPFPRDVAPGDRPVLAGRLGAGLARPRVFVAPPSGRVEEVDGGAGPGFRAPVAFPAAGRYAVELVADGPGGPEVIALLPVSAGGAPLQQVQARNSAMKFGLYPLDQLSSVPLTPYFSRAW
jgi:hypothetical protein